MRRDVMEVIRRMKKEGIKPNYAELAREFNCDYRVIKRYWEEDIKEKKRKAKASKLDEYKGIIEKKCDEACGAKAIYYYIGKLGFRGKYGIVKKYCRNYKGEQLKKATIRFETNPGLQAQVDWKESMILKDKKGNEYTINIFLVILGYSRKKYIELMLDRKQEAVFQGLVNAFKSFGGVPKEILFDNMKTVVDHSKSEYTKPVINSKMYEFSKDMGFEIKLCRAYRPQTKGKVENLAKIMERLKVFNNEFETIDDLDEIVRELNDDLNHEICQATNETPEARFEKEKEYLNPLPSNDLLTNYVYQPVKRKVTKESMIMYKGLKYSVEPKYIGKIVTLVEDADILRIYYSKNFVTKHPIIEGKTYNYHASDIKEILRSDAMKHNTEYEIENMAQNLLQLYDSIGGT